MKLIHLADLHLGKRVNEVPMLEEQQAVLMQILTLIEREQPQGVMIAGDIYDKPVPVIEAVALFDWFLTELSLRGLSVFVISGNHDSAERISFGANIMSQSRIFISPSYTGDIVPVSMADEFGVVNFYLLPFIKPAQVRRYFPEREIDSYQQAAEAIIERLALAGEQRNVLLCHQFITGAVRSDSEQMSVGGLDQIDAAVFAQFDYVALGHIHRPQQMGRAVVRYAGSPLKYSLSEATHNKSVTIAELRSKGETVISQVPLIPQNDMRVIRGSYEEVTTRKNYEHTNTADYLHIILSDEQDIPEALGKLRTIYPNILKLEYDNIRTRQNQPVTMAQAEEFVPMEYVQSFYQMQNNQPLSNEQAAYMDKLIEEIWG